MDPQFRELPMYLWGYQHIHLNNFSNREASRMTSPIPRGFLNICLGARDPILAIKALTVAIFGNPR